MKRIVFLAGVISCFLAADRVAAQERPDFSGAWSSQSTSAGSAGRRSRNRDGSESNRAAAGLGSGWGADITIIQNAELLSVERSIFTRSDLQPVLKLRFLLTSEISINTVAMGRGNQVRKSTVQWQEGKLVVTTVHRMASPEDGSEMPIEVKRVLSLLPPSQPAWSPSLLIETTRNGVPGGKPFTTRTVYSRR